MLDFEGRDLKFINIKPLIGKQVNDTKQQSKKKL